MDDKLTESCALNGARGKASRAQLAAFAMMVMEPAGKSKADACGSKRRSWKSLRLWGCFLWIVGGVWIASGLAVAQEPQGPSGLAILAAIEEATVSAIDKAERSVVAISRVRRGQAPPAQLDPLGFANPFPTQETPGDPEYVPQHFGSGVVISADGFIVTCAHVLDDPRQNDYYVWLDNQNYPARVAGVPAQVLAADPFSDLAVLKIDAENLQTLEFVTDRPRKGQFVIALGNPYAIARDGQASASWGIIANLRRVAPAEPNASPLNKETIHEYGTLIQTDAKLNLGFSGGALINLRGELIGLTTALAATAGYEQSAGFAIAVDETFRRVVESLKLGKLPEYGFLGIQPEDLHATERERGLRGAKVSNVIPGMPGELAGLRPQDVIFQVDSQIIEGRSDLFRELSLAPPGEKLSLHVQRSRTGRRLPDILKLEAVLSKKYVATSRPGYALHGPQKWRGMLVEYATAVPAGLERGGLLNTRRNAPKLAVLAVDPDTPAWRAGLRPGHGILAVAEEAVESPEAFRELVEGRSDPVTLLVQRSTARPERLTVAPVEGAAATR